MSDTDTIAELETHVEALKDEFIETAEAGVQVIKTNNKAVLTGVAIVSLAAGAAIGYYAAKKYLEPKYAAIADEEIEKARELYGAATFGKAEYPTPQDAVDALIPDDDAVPEVAPAKTAMRSYKGMPIASEEVVQDVDDVVVRTTVKTEETIEGDEVEIVKEASTNIFVNGQAFDADEWEKSVSERSEERPYVISEEEFFANEQDFEQWTLTYYAGDDVLCTEKDEVIEDVDAMVGEENLKRFGMKSNDMHLVYVKNNKRGLDFEIARSTGKYAKEVLGYDEKDDRPARRFRDSDD